MSSSVNEKLRIPINSCNRRLEGKLGEIKKFNFIKRDSNIAIRKNERRKIGNVDEFVRVFGEVPEREGEKRFGILITL